MTKHSKFLEYLDELADADRPLSIAGLYQLSDLDPPKLAALREAWPRIPSDRRRQMLALLEEISETSFEVDFRPVAEELGLADEDPAVRSAAIQALWEPEDLQLLNAFVRLLIEDEDAHVRAAAAGALGRFVLLHELDKLPAQAAARAEDALFEVVDSADEPAEVQRRAVESLGFSSDERVPAIIADAYQAEDEAMRASAVFAMGRSADRQWTATVLQELDSASPQMRYEAARAAGELELRRAVPRLTLLTDDPDREVQEAAIWALGMIGGKPAKRQLERLADSEDREVAEAADEALENLLMYDTGSDLLLFEVAEDDEGDEDEEEGEDLPQYASRDEEDEEGE